MKQLAFYPQPLPLLFSLFLTLLGSSSTLAHSQGFIDVNGVKLFYKSFGRGDPIIVLHAGPGLGSSYLLSQMVPLSEHNRVIFYDQRGAGKSLDTPVNERTINMRQYLSDLNSLRIKLGFNKVALVGHAWGGLLAMKYAIEFPHNVAALILLDTLPANDSGYLKYVQEYDRRMATLIPSLNQMQDSKEFMHGDPTIITNYYHMIFSKYVANAISVEKINLTFTNKSALSGLKSTAIMQKSFLSTKYNLLPELKKLRIPVLIIHGREDIIPLKTAKEIHKSVKNSEFVIIENCGNFCFIEQPDEVFDRINSFLSDLKAWR